MDKSFDASGILTGKPAGKKICIFLLCRDSLGNPFLKSRTITIACALPGIRFHHADTNFTPAGKRGLISFYRGKTAKDFSAVW